MKTAYIRFDGRRYTAFDNPKYKGFYVTFSPDRAKLEARLRKQGFDEFSYAETGSFESLANTSLVDALTDTAKIAEGK
jgi:hypothetical protein